MIVINKIYSSLKVMSIKLPNAPYSNRYCNYKIERMKHILFTVLIFSVLISCKESPETKFEKYGISLTCPTGWKITDEENLDNQGYYIAIEKDGFNSSGLVAVTWVNDSLDLYSWLEIFQDELKNNIVYKYSNLIFETPTRNEFNKSSSIAAAFKVSIIGVKHEGIIHVFYGNDKTIAVLIQEAVEDKAKNKTGFDIIERSFTLE